jgi:hypothetical protein
MCTNLQEEPKLSVEQQGQNKQQNSTSTGLVLANNPACKYKEATMQHIPFR